MKAPILIVPLLACSLGAFGQGKVTLQNSGISAITVGNRALAADVGLIWQAVPTTGPLPSGVMIEVGLYAGTTSASLSLVSDEVMNPVGGTGQAPGVIPFLHIVLPFAGGTLAFYQVKIWDSSYGTYDAAFAAGSYANYNNMFTMTAGTSIAYVPINGGGNSTWTAVGNDSLLYLSPMLMPEPAVFALAALAAAMRVVRLRRTDSSNLLLKDASLSIEERSRDCSARQRSRAGFGGLRGIRQ
jgi:hypothetical protein